VAKFNQSKNVKLDFEIISAIQNKKLTIGEFVAHFLSYNNLEDINSNISLLTGKDFLKGLKTLNIPFSDNEVNFSDIAGDVFNSVKKTYEIRHIFCHEFAVNINIDADAIIKNFNNCKIFLECSNQYIWYLLNPEANFKTPETQTEMNQIAFERFEKYDKELKLLIKEIKENHKNEIKEFFSFHDETLFDESIKKWEEYRHVYSDSKAAFVRGGSMHPVFYYGAMSYITEEKIESIKKEYPLLFSKKITLP
jgi:hypothetical protein